MNRNEDNKEDEEDEGKNVTKISINELYEQLNYK